MSSSPSPTFMKAYEAVKQEFKDNFDAMSKRGQQFHEKYTSVLNKLDGFFRGKCGEYISWLESNTEQTKAGPVLRDQSKQGEFENTLNNLQKCVEKNDVGTTELLQNFERSLHEMSEKTNQSFARCLPIQEEGEIRDCLRGIVRENLRDMETFYGTYQDKFEQVNRKL